MDAINFHELMPRSTKDTQRYSVVLPASIGNKIKSMAEKENRSYSQMIARLIEIALDQIEEKE